MQAPDGWKGIGVIVGYRDGAAGEIDVYHLSNGYMVKTFLRRVDFEVPEDRRIWEGYFKKHPAHASAASIPGTRIKLDELSKRGYDLSRLDRFKAKHELGR